MTGGTAPPRFEGRIGRTMAGSEPWWPPRATPREGAPNIVVLLLDDVGYADLGCYGGEIRTPNIDRIAGEGLRFTNFHVNPMCSPTRASLLTGVNAHATGVGHVAQDDPGFPGYRGELADDVATVAEVLRDHGYATLMTGKWHLARDADLSAQGPMRSWPCQRGFERFYGILDAFTNLHHPSHLVEDNHGVEVDRYPDGYYLTDDITDKAITLVRERKAANPRQPFFLYLAHAAAHAPLHARPDDIARYRGVYDAGWDHVRAERHRRQLELGVIAPGTLLPPRNDEPGHEVAAWDGLPAVERRLYARYMEVYAAVIDAADQSVGRLREALEEMGEWDNTVFLVLSDNGASREGEATGTTNYYAHVVGGPHTVELDAPRLDDIGSPRTMSHYPRGWAMASGTPFRLYKRHTHAGGHHVPCIWSWPAGLIERGGMRRQYSHCVDVVPTLLELVGAEPSGERAGVPTRPMDGRSLRGVLADESHPDVRAEQYYEMQGNRGFYREGWEVVTCHRGDTGFDDGEWELYDLRADPTEVRNLAGDEPGRVAELARGFDAAARANLVYPLDEGSGWRWLVRPPHDAVFAEPVTIWPGTPTLERWRSSRLIWQRDVTITIDLDLAGGDRGVLLAHGDQGGGYAVYVDDGRAFYVHNDGHGTTTTVDAGTLDPGHHRVVLRVVAPGRVKWDVAVLVDDEERGRADGLAMLWPMSPFEGIDVGIDRRSPVSWGLYEREGPFPFTGRMGWVRYEPGQPAPDSPDRFVDALREMGARFE